MTDPLVHFGRHFSHTVYAFCNVKLLLTNGLKRFANDQDINPIEMLPAKYGPPRPSYCYCFDQQLTTIYGTTGTGYLPGIDEHLCWFPRETLQHLSGGSLSHSQAGELNFPCIHVDLMSGTQIQKGMNGSHADNTKGMKSAIID